MTGRYASSAGMPFASLHGAVTGLPENLPTMPQLLRKASQAPQLCDIVTDHHTIVEHRRYFSDLISSKNLLGESVPRKQSGAPPRRSVSRSDIEKCQLGHGIL